MIMTERQTIWDPLRKRQVTLTPEENVRQWFISRLAEDLKVPMHMMMSEVALKLGQKQLRADIVVYDRKTSPLMVVECKRPDVELDASVLEQAVCYNMVLDVRYIVITNGIKTYFAEKGTGGSYSFVSEVPDYQKMMNL